MEYPANVGHPEKTKFMHHRHTERRRISLQGHWPDLQKVYGKNFPKLRKDIAIQIEETHIHKIDMTRRETPHCISQ